MTGADPLLHRLGGGGSSGGYVIDGSIQLKAASSQYFEWTPASTTDAQRRTFSFDLWLHRTQLPGGDAAIMGASPGGNSHTTLYFNSSQQLVLQHYVSNVLQFRRTSSRVFRDVIAFDHLNLTFDSPQAVEANRLVVKYNGEVVSGSFTGSISQNSTTYFFADVRHVIGCQYADSAAAFSDGYFSQIIGTCGGTLDVDATTETDANGYFVPIEPTGITFGANGFWIKDATGTDHSGNIPANHWTPQNSPVTVKDSPTNDPANDVGLYPVLSAINKNSSITVSHAGTRGTFSAWRGLPSTFVIPDTGIWEVKATVISAAALSCGFGLARADYNFPTNGDDIYTQSGVVMHSATSGSVFVNDSVVGNAGTYAVGNDMRYVFNANTNVLYIYKNGSLVYTSSALTKPSAGWRFFCTCYDSGGVMEMDFGQGGWTPAHTGAKYLCLAHFDEPDCADPDTEYYVGLHSHTNGSPTTITLPWNPLTVDTMVRLRRTDTTFSWYCFDTVRGGDNYILWNTTGAEVDNGANQGFVADGFQLGAAWDTGTYFIEAFKVGQYFQIKTYTGTGAAHTESFPGTLAAAPGLLVTMYRGGGNGHLVYHSSIGATGALNTTSTGGTATSTTYWNDTAPTTSGFTVGTANVSNQSGVAYVAYAWAKAGPYRFGSYTGNGSTDGAVANVGGKSAAWFNKATTLTTNWPFRAAVLGSGNPLVGQLWLNENSAMPTYAAAVADLLSTGFKLRYATGQDNDSGYPYVFGAFGVRALRGPGTAQARAV